MGRWRWVVVLLKLCFSLTKKMFLSLLFISYPFIYSADSVVGLSFTSSLLGFCIPRFYVAFVLWEEVALPRSII
jgi:hypothetical protein